MVTRFLLGWAVLSVTGFSLMAASPNVLIVITDDQGFGDLGVHGNPVIKTPNLDAFSKQSVWLKNFYVCPVCSPTRSSLLTGAYNYRTGVVDTFIGRSMMRADCRTLAHWLGDAGYRTALFGKWHLGDNYPLRPEDRGFQHTLWHHGGGLAQPSDAPEVETRTAYFDPILTKNGEKVQSKGYCTDVFTDAAIDYLKADHHNPFFAYVAYNAPHAPYQVDDKLAAPYQKLDLSVGGFPKIGHPWAAGKVNTTEIAKAYAMIENIDTNFARLMKTLDETKQADNTIVIFLTDNGPGGVRFNSGLRNRKGTVYEGGIRVPCYIRWPARLKPGHIVELPTAHIDIVPTLKSLCGIPNQESVPKIDGRDLSGLLKDEPTQWNPRNLYSQWHRGDAPEKFRAFMVRSERYKLVQAAVTQPVKEFTLMYELFDLSNDPYEQVDIAPIHQDIVAKMKTDYEGWFADVTSLGFDPIRTHIGSDKQKVTHLSRQDWRGPDAGWTPESIGYWELQVEKTSRYAITLHTDSPATEMTLKCGDKEPVIVKLDGVRKSHQYTVSLDKGPLRLEAWATVNGKRVGVNHVFVVQQAEKQ